MSEIENLEKKLADLKRQRKEIESPEIDSHIEELKRYKETPEYAERPFFKDSIDRAIQGLIDAKRELEVKQIECPTCNITKKKEDEEPCPACEFAVGIGMYLNVCRELDSEENCQDLFEKVTNDRITPEEFFNIIREKAKDKPEKLDILGYIDELMEKASGEPPTPLISPYEEEWGQWWDGMDLSERDELSKKISVRSVNFFELTEEEKEAIRSYAAEEGIL